ncbi:AIPR family protein [Vibrio hyugaensis]|uniref:AIPR family protein n=1 Tax=Vibrio hyugaensis TaxID=1534743 RepID=UPI0005EDC3AC|nr:AIPR family protein [Vibrio hyugaensis]
MSGRIIKNRILLGILDEFQSDFRLSDDEAKSYEKLVNYVTVSKYDPEAFSEPSVFEQIDVDKQGTFGIDTFCLIINDSLVTSVNDIADQRKSKRMDVRFVFIQTKRSSSFDSGEFLKFTAAIKNFFSPSPSIELSEELAAARELVDELFKPENARLFSNKKPKCDVFFATAGEVSTEDHVLGVIAQEEQNLKISVPEIDQFTVKQIASDYMIDSYNEIENRSSVMINFEKNISCGDISGVEQSFIGYLPVNEFIKLIKGSDGNIRKNLFYENVRDFQGQSNSVNSEIAETLTNEKKIDKFLLLNNGITIVAKEFSNIRSTEYEICDYYIVNGCQTSNVLYQYAEQIENAKTLNVPIKIVHTTDNEVISSLIRSTNRQTPVPDEAFVSLEKFHKRLQEYYARYSEACFEQLYYERRSKEFSNGYNRVEKPRVVNLHAQIRSFTSIMLGEPQLAMSNNPTTILKAHKDKIFLDDHKYSAYFFSSLLLFLFYNLTEEGKVSRRYVISRYWICWIARVLSTKSIVPGNYNSDKTEAKIERVIDSLSDSNAQTALFRKSVNIYEAAKKSHREEHGRKYNSQLIRLKSFREAVLKELSKNL